MLLSFYTVHLRIILAISSFSGFMTRSSPFRIPNLTQTSTSPSNQISLFGNNYFVRHDRGYGLIFV